jgi:hypothetical protein
MQQRSTQDTRVVSPAQTIQALPPSSLMLFGRGNTVLIAHESGELLSLAASECTCNSFVCSFFNSHRTSGYAIVQVKSIFQPITEAPHLNQPFLYVEFFNFSPSLFNTFNNVQIVTPAPVTDMFLVHRHVRSNNTALGDISSTSGKCPPGYPANSEVWSTGISEHELRQYFAARVGVLCEQLCR